MDVMNCVTSCFISQLPVANRCLFTYFVKVQYLDEKLRPGVSVPSTEPAPLWLPNAPGGARSRELDAGLWEQGAGRKHIPAAL